MKFSEQHLTSLRHCIEEVYPSPALQRGTKSETRFLWDIFWASRWNSKFPDHFHDGNYKDSHIQTAVKYIVSEIDKLPKCSECGKIMQEDEHNYGTNEEAGNVLVCLLCYSLAQEA